MVHSPNGHVTHLAEAFRGVIVDATSEAVSEAVGPVQGEITSIRRDVTSLLEVLAKAEKGLNEKIDNIGSHREQDVKNLQAQLLQFNKSLGEFSSKIDKTQSVTEPTQSAKKRK